jgi:hypothetical protein
MGGVRPQYLLRALWAAYDLEQHPYTLAGRHTPLICPLLGGPKFMLFWTRKEKTNAIQETHAGGDYRQAA